MSEIRSPRPTRFSFARIAALLAFALLLGGCTIYVTPAETAVRGQVRAAAGMPLDDVIELFATTRGEGSSYRLGETLSFHFRSSRDGYVTLTARDPDGTVYTLARNLRVRAGRTHLISGPRPGFEFTLAPPRGLHRVRATFTDTQLAPTRVTYRAELTERGWTDALTAEIRAVSPGVRDITETRFWVR